MRPAGRPLGTGHGVRSFEGLRERSSLATVGDAVLRVAALSDIVESKMTHFLRTLTGFVGSAL